MKTGLRRLCVASVALVSTGAMADGVPPSPSATAGTDVGRVSTGGGDAEAGVVIVPSATGTRAQARAVKKNAPNEIEVQPQSEIAKLPDVNVAEALQRIPGISLETDSGEGRFINIRGLDADLNGSSFGGVRLLPSNLSSPQGGGRAVAFDALPAGLVGAVEVVKSLRPEDDAEGLGGAVNIVPRAPEPGGKPFLDATAGLGLETLRGTQILDYDLTFGGSFGLERGRGPFDHPAEGDGFFSNPRPFTILLTNAQHNDFRGVDDWEPAYSDQQAGGAPDKLLTSADLRRYTYNRRRYGRGGELLFDPNPEHSYYFRYAEAGYTEQATKDILTINNLDAACNNNLAPGCGLKKLQVYPDTFVTRQGSGTRSYTDSSEAVGNQVISWGGRDVLFDRVKLDYFGAFSEGTDQVLYSYGPQFDTRNQNMTISYNNTQFPDYLLYRVQAGKPLSDGHQYAFTNLSDSQSLSRDQEYSGALNVTLPITMFGRDEEIKAGATLRLRDRTLANPVQTYNGLPTTPGLFSFIGGPIVSFYDNHYTLGRLVNGGSIVNLLNDPAFRATQTVAADAIATAQTAEHDNENVYAGYVQYSGSFGKLSALTGMRIEQTYGVYRANATSLVPRVDANGNPVLDGSGSQIIDTVLTPNVNKHAYLDYFPSLQLKYAFSDKLIARAIYSTALARPGFNEITAATSIDVSNRIVSIGNPSLGATYGNNFDLALEYYLPRGGIASAAAFDKEFHGYILPHETIGTYPDPRLAGFKDVVIDSFSTSGHSRVYGAELAYTQQFTFLPTPLDGFGVDTNFTYNQSAVQIRPGETGALPSTSPFNYNAALFYEAHRINFRLAASFVSKNLFAIGTSKALDIYSQPRFRLDLGTSYQLTKNISVYFDAKNLTDTPLKFTETGLDSRPIQREFYGVDVLGGLRAQF